MEIVRRAVKSTRKRFGANALTRRIARASVPSTRLRRPAVDALSIAITAIAAIAITVSSSAFADWAESANPMAAKISPAHKSVVRQNPPDFSWSRPVSGPTRYLLEIRGPGNTVDNVVSDRNWHLPSSPMKPGAYSWRVRTLGSNEWSRQRAFTIASDSVVFRVPSDEHLKRHVRQRARPRSLPVGSDGLSTWSSRIRSERADAVAALAREVDYRAGELADRADPDWPLVTGGRLDAQKSVQIAAVQKWVYAATRQVEAAALLFLLRGGEAELNEALRRGDQLAAFSPDGPTSHANHDQASRQIALSLLKASDLLWDTLDPQRRQAWLESAARRAEDIYRDLSRQGGRLDQFPLDSHGQTTIGHLALISVLSIGAIPNADAWFDFAVRSYFHHVSPWSGPEGGYANGTAYAQHATVMAIHVWQALENATGVSLFSKPWSAGLLQFFTHFAPPGARRHVFGDDAELNVDMAVMKAYASRFASPLAAWYTSRIQAREDALTLLQAPIPLPVELAGSRKPPENSALYPSIGWVAMHSSMEDSERTSLYFKSSPYGSFNHSHGDQNSLILSKGGWPLLIDSGWYDWYGSPVWRHWYRQTMAHNAVTYDGGAGQLVEGEDEAQLTANGRIAAFSTSARMDYAEGDAVSAHAGALSVARRRVWYLRNMDVVVVSDKLVSPVPRVFEWNLHAPTRPSIREGGEVVIENNGRSVCVRPLTDRPLKFKERIEAPRNPRAHESHWYFEAQDASTDISFLFVLDVGCKRPAVRLANIGDAKALRIGASTIPISD